MMSAPLPFINDGEWQCIPKSLLFFSGAAFEKRLCKAIILLQEKLQSGKMKDKKFIEKFAELKILLEDITKQKKQLSNLLKLLEQDEVINSFKNNLPNLESYDELHAANIFKYLKNKFEPLVDLEILEVKNLPSSLVGFPRI